MKQILGKTGFEIFPVVYGGIISMNDGQKKSDGYVSYAIDRGVNYFDVAPSYGDAEEKLGKSLIPYRKDIYLACKTQLRDAKGGRAELEKSLKLLHTDYFDNYQLHALSGIDQLDAAFAADGIMPVLIRAKEQGLIRNVSFSAHSEETALEAMKRYDFSTILFPLNWMMAMGTQFGVKAAGEAKKRGMGVLGMKTLIHRAWLNDEEKKQSGFTKSWCKPIIDNEALGIAAMKYTLSLGADALVPPGNFEHFSFLLDHIEDCFARPLSKEDELYLNTEFRNVEGKFFF